METSAAYEEYTSQIRERWNDAFWQAISAKTIRIRAMLAADGAVETLIAELRDGGATGFWNRETLRWEG